MSTRSNTAFVTFGSALVLVFAVGTRSLQAATPLVTDDAIKAQKQLTETRALKNGIPVVLRQVAGSDIVQLWVSFPTGLRDLAPGRKILNRWLFSTMPMAAAGFPKEKVFALTEKYALELGCAEGIELSSCSLGTVNEYWKEALPLFSAMVKAPTLSAEDAKLVRERIESDLNATPEDPGRYVNEVVNRIFYPEGHPYRLGYQDALKELKGLDAKALAEYHKTLLNASAMTLVVVGSMPADQVMADLEREFGGIKPAANQRPALAAPVFKKDRTLAFEARKIPSAYIVGKVNAPGEGDRDAVAARLMFSILDEEMGEEIRTRRSLSYSAYGYVIQHSLGIGVIGASTSKPKETLEAMNIVLQKMKTKPYSAEELEERKHVFATDYFLTQESHAALASSLMRARHYFKDAQRAYDLPRELDRVAAADIQRLAQELLVNFRFGVMGERKVFQDKWVKTLVDKNLKK